MAQVLLVSVRGPNEAAIAIEGGAGIVDVEYPASALGTPYPLNISSVRTLVDSTDQGVQISTNIGEIQSNRSTSCQAALGVATAGADLIKFGLAELSLEQAVYLGNSITRTVKAWYPGKSVFPALFVDHELRKILDPFSNAKDLVKAMGADGLLVDTFDKGVGNGLLDYCTIEDIRSFVSNLHSTGAQAWVAGSITKDELPSLWATGVDVVCVRGAACESRGGNERFGEVKVNLVKDLVGTIPGYGG